MSEQQADTNDLERLTKLMSDLTDYCQALKQSANGFAYLLPSEWKGAASNSFIGTFETWQAQAAGLAEGAEGLRALAERSETVYKDTIEALGTEWRSYYTSLPS